VNEKTSPRRWYSASRDFFQGHVINWAEWVGLDRAGRIPAFRHKGTADGLNCGLWVSCRPEFFRET
jgi:hypothetical protein